MKIGETLWIKASGTWLEDAPAKDIMVRMAMPPPLNAIERGDRTTDTPQAFAIDAITPRKLRPSTEIAVHALMPQRVVLHVHCVDAISLAVQADCEAEIAARLTEIRWAFIPVGRERGAHDRAPQCPWQSCFRESAS